MAANYEFQLMVLKASNVLRQGVAILACGGLIAIWLIEEGNLVGKIVASFLLGRALWGLGTGVITLRGQEAFFEDRPYRFCILMLIVCLLGLAIAFGRSW